MVHCIIQRVTYRLLITSKQNCISFSKDHFFLANSVDPDVMPACIIPHYSAFHQVFSVYHLSVVPILGVSGF